MKLKTLKEMGLSDVEITIYDKVRNIKRNRDIKSLIYGCYSIPIFYLIVLFSAIVSSFISLFLLIGINKYFNFISSISFDNVYNLLIFIFILNLLPVMIFLFSIWCMGIYGHYSRRENDIKKEIYNEE